jgi:bifunctional non-homologous end joining protein LigD
MKKVNIQNITTNEKMPTFIKPMFATLTNKPFDKKNWIFELKWDGYRAMAYIKDAKVQLKSRNNLSFNSKFAPIVEELSRYSFEAILDGEIIAVDADGKSDFQGLQNYQRTKEGTLIYYVFDILHLNGKNLRNLPLSTRKKILKNILPAQKSIIRYTDHIAEKGTKIFDLVKQQGIEGIIAKKQTSIYEPGKRVHNWQKIKAIKRQEAIIAGTTPPKGGRKGFGSLVLGVYNDNQELVYIGQSGGGFNEKELSELSRKFKPFAVQKSPLKNPPNIKGITWLNPKFVCEVKFAEWTSEGIMRQPVFLGLRIDKNPKKVVREFAEL